MDSSGPKLSSCGQRRLWSDLADAQADLSLRWAHMPLCCFIMRRLKWDSCIHVRYIRFRFVMVYIGYIWKHARSMLMLGTHFKVIHPNLMIWRFLFKPELGGVRDVAFSSISHEKTQSNRVCCFTTNRFNVFLRYPFLDYFEKDKNIFLAFIYQR